MIIGVCVQVGGIGMFLKKPYRHGDVINALISQGVKCDDWSTAWYGFITKEGLILGRKEAMQYCIDNHIPHTTQSNLYDPMLFSEDLW